MRQDWSMVAVDVLLYVGDPDSLANQLVFEAFLADDVD